MASDKEIPIEEGNPIDDVLDQLEMLLKFLESKKGVPINQMQITPEVLKKLEKLESRVKKFEKLGETINALSQVPHEEVLKRKAGLSEELPPQGKHLIERAAKLHRMAESLSREFASEVNEPPPEAYQSTSDGKSDFQRVQETKKDSKAAKRRKGKFRHLGGDQDWRPM